VKSDRLQADGSGTGPARIRVAKADGSGGLRLLWTSGVEGNEQTAPAWSRR
jgi:hypothetical protein